MKISNYVIVFEREGLYFLYNTSTQAFFRINDIDYQGITKVITGKMDITGLSEKFIDFLKVKHCIDTNNDKSAHDFCVKMEYRKRFESFSGRTLSLVIAPTLVCNFACPYCYQSNLPSFVMSEEVEEDIVRFIRSYEEVCDNLEICWEGGEPLIAFETIKSLYSKIETQTTLNIKGHAIVTNGYLRTPEICSFFKEKSLQSAQITIDGNPDTHNKSRVLKSGKPTYDTILRNIDMLTEEHPSCKVIVRTNIHNGNKDEYGSLYSELNMRWNGKNVHLSPAFVISNEECEVSCCSPREKSEFLLSLKNKFHTGKFCNVPELQTGRCSATAEHSYIIDPQGNLYKCWNDIGKEQYCVGNVKDGLNNNRLIATYVIGSDKYSDPECLKCKLFPICDGGCNKQRMDNVESGTHNILCPFDETGICDELYEYYKSMKHAD